MNKEILIDDLEGIDFSFFVKERRRLVQAAIHLNDEIKKRYAKAYVKSVISGYDSSFSDVNFELIEEGVNFGLNLRSFSINWSSYIISSLYTSLLPDNYRSSLGIFYTPPLLVDRLLQKVEENGIDWSKARVIDPACGGGAFLMPIIARITDSLDGYSPKEVENHLKVHAKGLDIDDFGSWLTEYFINYYLRSKFPSYRFKLDGIIENVNSLTWSNNNLKYDLVIGNPPYGKTKLSDSERLKWKDSLYGHANYYGLFAHLGSQLLKDNGIMAYIMPSSFLGGLYFKNLRQFLLKNCPPIAADFVSSRSGIFPDVLQEICLIYFRNYECQRPVINVNFIKAMELDQLNITPGGNHIISTLSNSPWILPKSLNHVSIVYNLHSLPNTIRDLGYKVSTGPLVWNRHKSNLSNVKVENSVPIIWAECLNGNNHGVFSYKCEGRNHLPYYKPKNNRDPNVIKNSCILLQRTTAKEQDRRLIAAVLPKSFLKKHKEGVAIENHLNMIVPLKAVTPLISMETLNYLLNLTYLDQIFRTINGSTAVSAYEIESIPMPRLDFLLELERLLKCSMYQKAFDLMANIFVYGSAN